MRIVFWGTPEPAARALEALIRSKHEILCVVTQPDRRRGRGQKLSFSPVKEVALKHALPLEQPEEVRNNPAFKSLLESLKPDIAVVLAYGKILPKEILDIPKHGFINVHASLLPRYRGAAPIQWALLRGEEETGVTVFKLVELVDAGPIILQERVKIEEEDNAETLSRKLFEVGTDLLLKALEQIENGKAKFCPQNEAEATFAPALSKESGEIDWRKSAREIYNRVRALVVWPTAHTFYRGKLLKILKAEINVIDLGKELKFPGRIVQIVKGEGFIVATGEGELLILEVQPESGKKMKGYDFVIGHDVKIGETLPS